MKIESIEENNGDMDSPAALKSTLKMQVSLLKQTSAVWKI